MLRSIWFYLFIYLFIFNQNFLFSGLLPENIILTKNNKCCSVKNLDLGDQVASSSPTSYQLRNIYSNVSGIKLNRNSTNSATLLTLESRKKTISSIMVGLDQKFCVQINAYDFVWLEAEDLEPNMLVLGYNNKKFRVRDVQAIEFENSIDLYEISLNPNNTFYLIDSNGNRILTHNVFGVTSFIKATTL